MKTILLVDDDSFIRQLLAKFFQKMVFLLRKQIVYSLQNNFSK